MNCITSAWGGLFSTPGKLAHTNPANELDADPQATQDNRRIQGFAPGHNMALGDLCVAVGRGEWYAQQMEFARSDDAIGIVLAATPTSCVTSRMVTPVR